MLTTLSQMEILIARQGAALLRLKLTKDLIKEKKRKYNRGHKAAEIVANLVEAENFYEKMNKLLRDSL